MGNMTRIIVFDHTDTYLFELKPDTVLDARSTEEVNGEHSLKLTTTTELEKTNRLLLKDERGYWHEYVVLGAEDYHTDGGAMAHEYYCVWSLQYDLTATFIDDQFGCGVVPGHESVPQTARKALECALEGTERWQIGTISVTAMSSASFYRRTGWEGLQTVVERWGGNLHATITVTFDKVTGRSVDLLSHEGSVTPTRRFDYGADVTSIKRIVSEDVWPCRIVPLGKSTETEAGGYTRRPSIESVNGGVMWLQDDSVVNETRVPVGNNSWEYPTSIILNDTYEEPADIKAWALDHISEYTRPTVTYEAEVAQFVKAGLNAHGVALGDEVVVIDRTFGTDGLSISSRVVRIEQSLLDPSDVKLTIGNVKDTLGGQISAIAGEVGALSTQVSAATEWQSTATYIAALLGRINNEVNATGGYTYITEGQGIRCYDVAVSDPLVGDEASSVCEIKGGTMRIANTKTASGAWEWKTVFSSGKILAELIEAIGALSGYHAQLVADGLNVYNGATLLAHFGEQVTFYDSNGGVISSYSTNVINLGADNDAAVINLCNRMQLLYDGRSMLRTVGETGAIGELYMLVNYRGQQNEDASVAIASRGSSATNYAVIGVDASYDGSDPSLASISAEELRLSDPNQPSWVVPNFPMTSVVNALPVTLYDNDSASASSSATLSETAANFKRITIFYKDSDGNYSSVDVWSPNGKRVALSLTWINGASTQEMYQRVRNVTISGTSIATTKLSGDSKYRTGQVKLGATASVTNADYISITHVVGYR